MDNIPYSNREHDAWRQEVRELFERMFNEMKEAKDIAKLDHITVEKLAKIASHSSGQIIALWEANEHNKKASKIIEEVSGFWSVTKILVGIIVGLSGLFGAIKILSIDLAFKWVFYGLK